MQCGYDYGKQGQVAEHVPAEFFFTLHQVRKYTTRKYMFNKVVLYVGKALDSEQTADSF